MSIFLLIVVLALSAFTHLWNTVGFPSVHPDEAAYMRRAMVVLEGSGPIDKSYLHSPYDHPFFGQLFLAGIFRMIGYPDPFIHSIAKGDVHSVEMLYLVPRVLMGILAVIDTFLVYKIAERRYNRNVAIIASVLFAVMPMTWLLRMIMLESIQLPLILSAVLFATYIIRDSKKNSNEINKNENIATSLISGIFAGLAILTKIPAISFIPLVGFLVYINNMRGLNVLWPCFVAFILISLIWPIYAISVGDFNSWLDGVYYQTHRDVIGYKPLSPLYSIQYLFEIDPFLMALSSAALVFAAIRRDFFLLLWIIPLLIFFYFIHTQFFLLTPLLPAFCVASAKMISDLLNIINKKKIRHIASLTTISAIGTLGLVSTIHLITIDLNSVYFQAVAFVAKFLSYDNNVVNSNNNSINNYGSNLAVVSENKYYWIPEKVLHSDNYYKIFDSLSFSEPEKNENVLLIFDNAMESWMHSTQVSNHQAGEIQTLYNNTFPVAIFKKNKHPQSDIGENYWDTSNVEIRTNRTDKLLLNSSAFIVKIRNGTIIKDGSKLEIVIPVNQLSLPLYWNDSLQNCDSAFQCTSNFKDGWKDKTSFQISTQAANKTWSWIYGKEIAVKPNEQYHLRTHMKLNEFATASHIVIEGFNETSNKWYQIIQCPAGTNGPLEWHEFRCEITIPKSTSRIRPALNAGWSLQQNKEQAVTLFDNIYLSKKYTNKTNLDTTTSNNNNLVYNPDFANVLNEPTRIVSLCQLRGDFDVQTNYKLLNKSPSNWAKLTLIAQEYSNDHTMSDKPLNYMALGSNSSDGGILLNATGNTAGKFRITRSGSTITQYRQSLETWVPIYVGRVNMLDTNIVLQFETHLGPAQQPIKIAFDNHIINKGHIVNCQIK